MNLVTTKIGTGSTAFKALHALIFVVALFTLNLASANAWTDALRSDGAGVPGAIQTANNTVQDAATFTLRPPRRLRANHLELAIGVFASYGNTRPLVSPGPMSTTLLKANR